MGLLDSILAGPRADQQGRINRAQTELEYGLRQANELAMMQKQHELQQQAKDAAIKSMSDKALLSQGYTPDQFPIIRALMVKDLEAQSDILGSKKTVAGAQAGVAKPMANAELDSAKASAGIAKLTRNKQRATLDTSIYRDNALNTDAVTASDLMVKQRQTENESSRLKLGAERPGLEQQALQGEAFSSYLKANPAFAEKKMLLDATDKNWNRWREGEYGINELTGQRSSGQFDTIEQGAPTIVVPATATSPAITKPGPATRITHPGMTTGGMFSDVPNTGGGPIVFGKSSWPSEAAKTEVAKAKAVIAPMDLGTGLAPATQPRLLRNGRDPSNMPSLTNRVKVPNDPDILEQIGNLLYWIAPPAKQGPY